VLMNKHPFSMLCRPKEEGAYPTPGKISWEIHLKSQHLLVYKQPSVQSLFYIHVRSWRTVSGLILNSHYFFLVCLTVAGFVTLGLRKCQPASYAIIRRGLLTVESPSFRQSC
jgi:hypothetical protein